MIKRLLSITIILSMLCMLISGCAENQALEATASQAAETSAGPAEPMPEEEEQPAEVPVTEESPADMEESPLESETEELRPASISYPLAAGDSLTFKVFFPLNTGYSQILTDWNDAPTLEKIQAATGASLEFIQPSEQSRTEKFNLMIVSGDIADFFNSSFYTGGAVQALVDEMILDLTDMLQENAPDYYSVIQNVNYDSYARVVTDDGRMLFISDINLNPGTGMGGGAMGNIIRKDWLTELNLEIPSTTSELKDVLTAFVSAYDCTRTFHLENDGIMKYVCGAFGTPGFDLTGATGVGLYREGETVLSALQSDGYREYIEYLADLCANGLVNPEFYAFARSAEVMNQITILGYSGIWESDVKNIVNATATARQENPSYETTLMAAVVKDTGDTYELLGIATNTSATGMCVWSGCEEPELALQFANWFFTDEGKMLTVYGPGEIYNVGSDGSITFTDFITNNPDGLTAFNLQEVYSSSLGLASIYDPTVFYYTYDDNIVNSISLWEQGNSSKTLPDLTLTIDESNTYTALSSDICTTASEQILKWVVGEQQLTDDSWEQFQSQIADMGINQCLAVYQTAFDRYNSR